MYISNMAGFSYRLMYVFLFAALVLNVSNYFFVRVYSAARQNSFKFISMPNRKQLPSKFWSTAPMYGDGMKPGSDSSQSSPHYLVSDKIKTTVKIEDCPEQPPNLGPESLNRTRLNVPFFKAKLEGIKPGGIYQPANCKSVQSVAIIIPYRGRRNYLTTFMKILHPFLIKQQLDYQIFVVEQKNKSEPYNRGKLLNVGFTEATRRRNGFRCIVLHESHIVPMDTRNLYRCSWNPRQLATVVERPTQEAYEPLLGGALAMTPEQFLKCNGFSNTYFGNDADYHDLYNRINSSNYFVDRSYDLIGKYRTIRKGLPLWHKTNEYLSTPAPAFLLDGLTSLTYSVKSFELRRLFTYLQVNLDDVSHVTGTKSKMCSKISNPVTSKTATQRTTDAIIT